MRDDAPAPVHPINSASVFNILFIFDISITFLDLVIARFQRNYCNDYYHPQSDIYVNHYLHTLN
jgi:hypothetical protein